MSYPVREKYASIATLDDMSLDTILTMPGTPQQGEVEERVRLIKEELQVQLEQQKPLVIAETDIVTRVKLLDQFAFEQQRLRLASHHMDIEIMNRLDQRLEFQVPPEAS